MTGTERLARYSRKRTVPQAAAPIPAELPEKASDKEPYIAYRLSKTERRYLEIRPKYPQSSEIRLNSMLTNMTGEWRMGLAISFSYGHAMMVKLRGERLTELLRSLQEWKVEFIQEFDPETHEPPTDPTAPVIKSIEILTQRPEAPPPMDRRH